MKKFLLVFCGLCAPVYGQTLIDNFTAATNDLFANDPSFIGSGLDFSGIGRTTQGNGRWATLIDDNIFVTANHFQASGDVTFFESNDPSSISHTRTVAGGAQIGSTDFFLGYFADALPSTITRYDFTTRTINRPNPDGELVTLNNPDLAFTFGISPSTGGYAENSLTNAAVGQNRLEFYINEGTATGISGSTDSLLTVQNEPGDSGFTYQTYESALQNNDSGSPLLVSNGSSLEFFGIATAAGTVNITEGTRNASQYSYIGNYTTEVQTFITANLNSVVPEPSTALLSLLASSCLLLRHRASSERQ